MSKDCLEARAVLFPLDEPKPSSRRVERAREHLLWCSSCSEFFAAERSFVSWLRGELELETAPPALRERVLERRPERAVA